MSRFTLCNCPVGFNAAPERHAPDCPGRSGAGKPSSFVGNPCQTIEEIRGMAAAVPPAGEHVERFFIDWNYQDFVADVDGDFARWDSIAPVLARLQAENAALQARLTVADQRGDDLETKLVEVVAAVRTINRGRPYEVRVPGDDEPQYRQRKEWVDWLLSLCAEAIAHQSAPAAAVCQQPQAHPARCGCEQI